MSFRVTFNNQTKVFEKPVKVLDIVGDDKSIICVKVNSRIRELTYVVDFDCEIVALTVKDRDAKPTYEASLRFLVAMAMKNIHPELNIRFSYNVSRSIFMQILNPKVCSNGLMVRELDEEMRRLVELDIPMVRHILSKEDAKKSLSKKDMKTRKIF